MIADLKPYPAYRDSGVEWLGQVPEGWEVLLSRRFCRVFAGATPSRDEPSYWDGGEIPWLASGDVNQRRISAANQFITEAGFRASSTKWISPGSIVIALAGQGKTKGMAALVDIPATCNQSLGVLEASAGSCDPEFLLYYLESRYRDIRGLVGDLRDGLNLEHLKQLPVPIPPLAHQSEIARFLNHVDSRVWRFIATQEQLINLLEESQKAAIYEAVSRGVDSSASFRPSGIDWIGELPAHWDVHRAKWCFREIDERSAEAREELLSVSHLTGVTPRTEKKITMFQAESYIGHKICRAGDLVINTMWAWMGALGVSPQTGIASPSYAVYRPNLSFVDPRYFEHLLTTSIYIGEFNRRSTGIQASRLRLYPDDFLRIPMICPPLEEQRAIAAAIDSEISRGEMTRTAIHGQVRRIREYRNRLISDVVTGKLDVREAAAKLPDDPDAEDPALDERLEEVAAG